MKEQQRRAKPSAVGTAAALQLTSEGGTDEFAELLGVLSTKMKRKQGDMQKRIETAFHQKLDELNKQSAELFTQLQQECQEKLEEFQSRCQQHLNRQQDQLQQLRGTFQEFQTMAAQVGQAFAGKQEELNAQLMERKQFHQQAEGEIANHSAVLRQQLGQTMQQQLDISNESVSTKHSDIKHLLNQLKTKLPAGINMETLEALLVE